jgi:hypothetical protein
MVVEASIPLPAIPSGEDGPILGGPHDEELERAAPIALDSHPGKSPTAPAGIGLRPNGKLGTFGFSLANQEILRVLGQHR